MQLVKRIENISKNELFFLVTITTHLKLPIGIHNSFKIFFLLEFLGIFYILCQRCARMHRIKISGPAMLNQAVSFQSDLLGGAEHANKQS